MNKRQVLTLWIIAIALVIALVAVNSSSKNGYQSATERARGETLLEAFKPQDVNSMTITNGEDSVRLKKEEAGWVVTDRDNYPANTPNVNELLRTVAEVKVTQGIEAEPQFAPRFGMDPKAEDDAEKGVTIELGSASGDLTTLTFGRNLESGSSPGPFGMGGGSTGRFVRNHADNSGIYVTKELFPTLTTEANRWLDDSFLKVEKIKSIEVSKPGKENETEWKVTRENEGAEFELVGKKDIEKLDASAINPLKSLFSYARFEDVIPAAEDEAAWDKEKRQTAVIETVEGFTYSIIFGPKSGSEDATGDPYLMKIVVKAEIPEERKKADDETEEDAKEKDEAFATRKKELEEKLAATQKLQDRSYQVTKFTVDALLKNRTGLIQSAAPAATAPQPGIPGLPPGAAAPRRRVQAVTPPIEIPAAPPAE